MEASDSNLQGLFKAYNTAFTKAQLDASGRVGTHGVTFEELAYAIKSNARLRSGRSTSRWSWPGSQRTPSTLRCTFRAPRRTTRT